MDILWQYQFRIILLGDSTVGKSSLLKRFTDGIYSDVADPTVGVDFYARSLDIEPGVKIKLQLWDTAGQERFSECGPSRRGSGEGSNRPQEGAAFTGDGQPAYPGLCSVAWATARTRSRLRIILLRVLLSPFEASITTSYYRNSVGGLLVFDLTNRKTFDHVREWHKEVSEHILPHHMVYILIGHKSDLNKDRKVSRDEAEQLAADLGVRYVETSAKCNSNVDRAFELLTRDIYELMKMGEIVTRDGWDGVKSGLTAKVLYPAEDEEEVAMATAEKGCHC
ncbi:Ras-related protein [Takifugu flavidus]|uniref:Ras-related protein n=1 Tax=Takifugu flavidus TaxID=433684 RepID=A0A5C6NF33_9TELE|nr:Ras-related protein [Takifugu flavidus]